MFNVLSFLAVRPLDSLNEFQELAVNGKNRDLGKAKILHSVHICAYGVRNASLLKLGFEYAAFWTASGVQNYIVTDKNHPFLYVKCSENCLFIDIKLWFDLISPAQPS